MDAWDLYTCDFPGAGPHPAVIVSHAARARNKAQVEVLLGSTRRAGRAPNENEVLLNGADGLDWETLVRCDLIYAVPKESLARKQGRVTSERK